MPDRAHREGDNNYSAVDLVDVAHVQESISSEIETAYEESTRSGGKTATGVRSMILVKSTRQLSAFEAFGHRGSFQTTTILTPLLALMIAGCSFWPPRSDEWEEIARTESESGEFAAILSWQLEMGHARHRLTVERGDEDETLYQFYPETRVSPEELSFIDETTILIVLPGGTYCEVAFDPETLEPDNECPTGNIEDDGGRPADETDS